MSHQLAIMVAMQFRTRNIGQPRNQTEAHQNLVGYLRKFPHTLLRIESRWRDSNPRPVVYKTTALPLSYTGALLKVI